MNMNYETILPLVGGALLLLITIWKRKSQMGSRWSDPEGKKLAVKNKELKCHHCGCDSFRKAEGLLNTSVIMFFKLGFLNRSAGCFTCVDCGFVHWFVSPDEKVYKEFDKDDL